MTRPIYEPSLQRTDRRLGYGTDQLFRRPGRAASPGTAIYEIKVFEDWDLLTVGDDKFVWEIPEDLDGASIVKVEAYISTAGGNVVTVQIRASDPCDTGADILTTPITIDAGECNSKDAAVQPVISGGIFDVNWGDHLHIDVDTAGDGAQGLGVIVALSPAAIASVVLAGAEGPQGPPGGIVNWMGEWDIGTAYVTDDAVSHNGSSYVAIAGSTGVEPGVTAGWETSWMLLAEGSTSAGLFDAYALLRDQKSAGTDGGSFTAGAWRTRDLNTEAFDDGGIVTLASNQFTLNAGTYFIYARAPAYSAVDHHKVKIYNITDATDVLIGSTMSVNQLNVVTDSIVQGRFTIAGTKTFELQHRCQTTKNTDGFGTAFSFGVIEVYAEVQIWREP